MLSTPRARTSTFNYGLWDVPHVLSYYIRNSPTILTCPRHPSLSSNILTTFHGH